MQNIKFYRTWFSRSNGFRYKENTCSSIRSSCDQL